MAKTTLQLCELLCPAPTKVFGSIAIEGNDSEGGEEELKVRGYLLEFLNGTLVDTSALVDQVA